MHSYSRKASEGVQGQLVSDLQYPSRQVSIFNFREALIHLTQCLIPIESCITHNTHYYVHMLARQVLLIYKRARSSMLSGIGHALWSLWPGDGARRADTHTVMDDPGDVSLSDRTHLFCKEKNYHCRESSRYRQENDKSETGHCRCDAVGWKGCEV